MYGCEASLEGLIKVGTLALQLLPRNALKGVYVGSNLVMCTNISVGVHLVCIPLIYSANVCCITVFTHGRCCNGNVYNNGV